MPKPKATSAPPIVVIFGDEEYRKAGALRETLDGLLPPDVDRQMALCEYDGSLGVEQGGADFATVMDDLATLSFFADRRVVVIRDADKFIDAQRQRLERYLAAPVPTGSLVLICRSFPKNRKIHAAAGKVGGRLLECKKLSGRGLIDFVLDQAARRKKRIDRAAAARVVELVGNEQWALSHEVEKLCLYAAERPAISAQDVRELVGQSREERIFAVMDAAGAGRPAQALQLWHQTLASDPAAVFKALGGMAFVVRRWLGAHEMLKSGANLRTIAPKLMMWGREAELQALLTRLPPRRLSRLLAAIAQLDSQAKGGLRSIDTGIEALLLETSAAA